MRITMKGHGRKLYSPEEVDLTFRFEYTNKNYKNVFQKGTQEVLNFVNSPVSSPKTSSPYLSILPLYITISRAAAKFI